MKKTRLSVVTPCYNEEDSLPMIFYRFDLLERLMHDSAYDIEFVIVDDGSSDKTPTMLALKYANKQNVKIITHPSNKGFGAALKTGLRAASGEIVVTIDADTNYDHEEIPEILDYLCDGVDVVTASPFHPEGKWNYPIHRFIPSRTVVALYKFVLRGKADSMHTMTSGFRVYRAHILKDIMPAANDFLATAELLVRALLKGYRVKEYPTVLYERKFGVSKLKTFKTTMSHLRFMWKIYRGEIQ